METKSSWITWFNSKNGHTLRSFAKDSNISLSYLSLIVNKKAEPSPKMAKKIADNLNVDMEELFVYRTKEA